MASPPTVRSRVGLLLGVLLLLMVGSGAGNLDCQWYALWPFPSTCSAGDAFSYSLNPTRFQVTSNAWESKVLQNAVERFKKHIFLPVVHVQRGPAEPQLVAKFNSPLPAAPKSTSLYPLDQLEVFVYNSSDGVKAPNADESFELIVNSTMARLQAPTVWGALYGLEAFSQLVMYKPQDKKFYLHGGPILIRDQPRFAWRGLLIDTANRFLSLGTIRTIIDAMAYDRFNVLHWHIVGSYSFAVELNRFQRISQQGRWFPGEATYSQQQIRDIVDYARDRGVRVVVELDCPGHAYSWGLGYPNLTIPCPLLHDTDIGQINSVPLDPTKDFTYYVLESILTEFAALFPDLYLHVGGDEVQYECWAASPSIQKYMKLHNMTSYAQLQAMFERRLMTILQKLDRRAVVWADTFAEVGHVLPPGSVVEVWNNATLMEQALAQGLQVLLADGWYLDRQVPVDNETTWFWQDTWAMMYGVRLTDRALGGEANMWGEQVADKTIVPRIWPRASAVAERLWSPENITDAGLAAQRLSRHRCVMSSRDVAVDTIWSGYCQADLVPPAKEEQKRYNFSANQLAGVLVAAMVTGILLVLGLWPGVAACWRRLRKLLQQPSSRRHHALTGSEQEPLLAGTSSLNDTSAAPNLPATAANDLSVASKNGPAGVETEKKAKRARLSSLDVFRGLTIALMIFVDNAGAAFPEIDHCPWDGIRLADFVMPFFDWMVGVSLALAFCRFDLDSTAGHRWLAFRKATWRFLKLFLIGVATQGGIDFMDYKLSHIRIMGILQRVAVCYYAVALMEIFLPRRNVRILPLSNGLGSTGALFSRYAWHWLVAACLLATHTGIMYGVNVPPTQGLPCGRGVLTPPCNAATYIDRHILTVPHMYFPSNGGDENDNDVTYQRLPECSSCSPGKCLRQPDGTVPSWCVTGPFDPEGMVSTLNAIITTIIGVHFGHGLLHLSGHQDRLMQWLPFSGLMLVVGVVLHFVGVPMNTDLYSISYTLVTAGVSGAVFSGCYLLVDVRNVVRFLWRPFMFFGMNAITMYLLAEGGIIQWLLSKFYLGDKEDNLANIFWPTGVYWGDKDIPPPTRASHNVAVLVWCFAYIALWMFVSWLMYRAHIVFKI